jgi:hypothetical protein
MVPLRLSALLAVVLWPLAAAASGELTRSDALVLDDETRVRLVGIMAPKLPLGHPGFRIEPLVEQAKSALAELILGRRLTLSYGGRRVDRYGRTLAHLQDESGAWIQGEMMRRGLARVHSFADNRAAIGEMLAFEAEARAAGRGVWALEDFRVIGVADTAAHIGAYQVVEGRVLDAAVIGRRGYLNFGEDYGDDFTISIAPRDVTTFRRIGIDILTLEGRRVRVRGWLKSFNGPMIDVIHPEQIEVPAN